MAYILNKSNGQQLTILNDGLTDSQLTSLTLVGKNVSNFGDAQNENFLFLLENFADSSITGGQPRSPVTGQFWFDTSTGVNRPLVFDGTYWRPMSVSIYGTSNINTQVNALSNPRYSFAATQPGDFWIDSVNKQLYVVTSTASDVSLIGPEVVSGFGKTRMSSVAMYDDQGNAHPVIQTILNNEIVSVFSNITFDSTTTNQVEGFPKVYRGVTFKNYSTGTRFSDSVSDVVLYGLHDQLDSSYLRRNVDEHVLANWYIDSGNQLNFGTTAQSNVLWDTSTNALTLNSTAGIKLLSNSASLTLSGASLVPSAGMSIGSIAVPFSNLYATNITATTITAADIYQSGERVLTRATLPDAGVASIQGTINQIAATSTNGVATLSLPTTVNITNLNATSINSTNISGSVVTDNGARVITTATIPFSISTITGITNQISVNVTDRTATLGFATNSTMTNLNASYITANGIYENGYRVLTTATLPAAGVVSVSGTTNQIDVSNTSGIVTVKLSDTVNVSTINASTSTIGKLTATNVSIGVLTASNVTIATLAATAANVNGFLNATSAGIGTLAVSGDATFYNNLTATNVYSSGNMIGYNVRGTYGNFSNQLNAASASIDALTVATESVNTLTVTTLKDSLGTGINKIDKDGAMTANSDLNLVTQKAIVTYVNNLLNGLSFPTIPTGSVFFVAMQTPPAGYLVCDGSSYSTASYPELYSEIGYTHGGSGANFNVPDLRGQFVRGWDSGRGLDAGRAFGTGQEDALQGHRHIAPYAENNIPFVPVPNTQGSRGSNDTDADQSLYYTRGPESDGINGTIRVAAETRPTNVALLPIIKI